MSFSRKWSFWCWYWGWFDTPQHPQNLVGMVHVGTKFCPQVRPMRREKKLTHLLNVRVKQLSFSQKWSFWCWYWGWFDTPQLPQNSVGTVHVGIKFCPQVPPTTQGGKMPCMVFVRVKLSNFSKKNTFLGSNFEVILTSLDAQYLSGFAHMGLKS